MTQLVIVTGTSGSGKTTTCKEFVDQADALWLHFGIDMFLGTLVPRKFVDGGPRAGEGVHMAPDDPGDPSGPAHLSLGTRGAALVATMHEMIASAVAGGQPVIMDHITTQHPPILPDAVRRLRHLPVLFVALRPPLELLAQRIDGRLAEVAKVLGEEHAAHTNAGTKRAARYMAGEIFSHDCFDLVIDSGALSPAEVARRIHERLEEGPPGAAFTTLAQRLDGAATM